MKSFDIKSKIDKRDKSAFLSGLIAFFVVHMYNIIQYLPNHDGLSNFYGSQNVIGSGRWFLSIACLPSTNFDLPWAIGVLSALYLALTMVFIVRIFDIKNTSTIIIASALTVSFPAISETLLFKFTADGYFLAMLLAAIGVRLVTTENQKWYMYIISGVLLCLSCGIYQAYFSFGAVLALAYLVLETIKNQKTTKELLCWSGKQILLFGGALVAYYVTWKVCLALQHAEVNDYQGISDINPFSISGLFVSAYRFAFSLLRFAFGNKFYKGDFTVYTFFGALFFLAFLCIVICVIRKRKLLKEKGRFFLFLAALAAMPVGAYMWQFVSSGVAYDPRMLQGLSLIYILPVVLCEKYLAVKWKNIAATTTCILIGIFSLQANIAYMYLGNCYEATYQTTSEMVQRAHLLSETGEEKIVVIGNTVYDTELNNFPIAKKVELLSGSLKTTLAYNHGKINLFSDIFFNESLEFATAEEVNQISTNPEINDMPCWPLKDSIKNIDGYIVIKLADPVPVTE